MKQVQGMVQGDRNGVLELADFSFDMRNHWNIIQQLKNRKEVGERNKGN
jgi:hypothetical protein